MLTPHVTNYYGEYGDGNLSEKSSSFVSNAASGWSRNESSRLFLAKNLEAAKNEENEIITKQLLSHVPDSVICGQHNEDMPVSKEFLGIVLFADISGFTALTEKYCTLGTCDGTSGTEKLSATLNAYIGKIVDEIIMRGGDVLKFAGDAILATWKCSDIGHNTKPLLNKVINCSIDIQSKCENYMTEVGIVLRVKLAIAIGSMCLINVGLPEAKQFDISGLAIDDVGFTEKQATPGSVILSKLAWIHCDQSLFSVIPLEGGKFYQVSGHAEKGAEENDVGLSKGNQVTKIVQNSERLITSSFDELIDQLPYYTNDMPKALMMDEDEKIDANRYLAKVVVKDGKGKKRKKFDRQNMTSSLRPQEVENLRAYVPEPVIYKLDHGQNLDWLSEMRQVSVLFINMKLPTAAKDASQALQKAFEVIHESCTKYKGTLNKVFGFDKGCTFLVIFGLPGKKLEDDPVRALKCAYHIFDSLHALPEIINESIGVTTGLAFCGVIGHKDRHEYTVIGSKVNMAARLMMYYPGIITCDPETFEGAKIKLPKQDFHPMPYKELKGMKDTGVVRQYNPKSSKKNEEEGVIYPMLGRKHEINGIKAVLNKYGPGKAQSENGVVVIEGEAGIGKSRLLEEVMDEAEKRHMRVIHVEGDLSHSQSSSYIVNSILNAFIEVEGIEKEKFVLSIVSEDEEIMENMGLLSDILRTNVPLPQKILDMNENERRTHANRIIARLINLIIAEQPCIITIDNARYVDDESWEILKNWIKCLNTVFIFAIRTLSTITNLSTVAAKVLTQNRNHHVNLVGLNKEQIVDFACQLLEVNELPKKLCDILHEKSQGRPSWCDQLVKDMIFSNAIQIVPKQTTATLNKSTSEYDTNADDRRVSNALSEIYETQERDKKERRTSLVAKQTSNLNHSKSLGTQGACVKASLRAIPYESEEMCILTPGFDLKSMLVPDSMKDMVLARMDGMTMNEQTVLKCASVLGQNFTRDLIRVIIPKNCVNMLDTTLYNLVKQKYFECGSLAQAAAHQRSQSIYDISQQEQNGATHKTHHHHHHGNTGIHNVNVFCGCYTNEGFPIINISQANTFADNKKRICLYFQFCETFVQEAAYGLWLEDQRKSLQERAAQHLEKISNKCKSCGGDGFIPGYGTGMSASDQLKNANGFSMAVYTGSSKYRAMSRLASGEYDTTKNILEEALALKEKSTSEHLKNYVPIGSHGESIGLTLIRMARSLAQSKIEEEKPGKGNKTNRNNRRIHPTSTVGGLITDFGNTAVLSSRHQKTKKVLNNNECEFDLTQCQCAELHALILPQLVFYWKAAGNQLKTFHYTVAAAAANLNINRNMKALALLKEADEMMRVQDENDYREFVVTDEERARVECFKGQAKCAIDCLDEGIQHFHSALKLLKAPQPTTKHGIKMRTKRASLVQTLHQNMPGVFTENKSDYTEFCIDQVHCLSFLSKAYDMKKDYERAYLANLEQLNAVEEACEDHWNERMTAYTNMIVSCLHYEKFKMGRVYEKLAMERIKPTSSASLEEVMTMGQLYLTLTSFHLANRDITSSLSSGLSGYKAAKSINDLNMIVKMIPPLVHLYLLRLFTQSCSDILVELQKVIKRVNDHQIKWTYYSCCVDLLLDSGDSIEPVPVILNYVKTKDDDERCNKSYIKNGLALWYARQNHWADAEKICEPMEEVTFDEKNPTRYYRLLSMITEYSLHKFRIKPSTDTLNAVQNSIKTFRQHLKAKALFQARLYHLQAYFAYLRNKTSRAKMLLEDCVVASKHNGVTFDYEWALGSKREWFKNTTVKIDTEQQNYGPIKFILPAPESSTLRETILNMSLA